jgi:hypothetical protein
MPRNGTTDMFAVLMLMVLDLPHQSLRLHHQQFDALSDGPIWQIVFLYRLDLDIVSAFDESCHPRAHEIWSLGSVLEVA